MTGSGWETPHGKGASPDDGTKARAPLDLEALSPAEAARALKRHNQRLRSGEGMVARTIPLGPRRTEPPEEDAETLRSMLAKRE